MHVKLCRITKLDLGPELNLPAGCYKLKKNLHFFIFKVYALTGQGRGVPAVLSIKTVDLGELLFCIFSRRETWREITFRECVTFYDSGGS